MIQEAGDREVELCGGWLVSQVQCEDTHTHTRVGAHTHTICVFIVAMEIHHKQPKHRFLSFGLCQSVNVLNEGLFNKSCKLFKMCWAAPDPTPPAANGRETVSDRNFTSSRAEFSPTAPTSPSGFVFLLESRLITPASVRSRISVEFHPAERQQMCAHVIRARQRSGLKD